MSKNYQFVFGPVPSRRLGRSLGISPIPAKTCNYSCVYCQLGRTTNYTNIPQEFYPKEEILSEIRAFLASRETFDYITFVGEGEPTLNLNLGWLISQTKKITDKPVAVITNGALLYDKKTRKRLLQADIVLPTLDACSQELFKKVNRPIRPLKIERIIQGMQQFRREYPGQIWMEVMLVKGLNDQTENIDKIDAVLSKINCERVYVNVPIRPPAEKWVEIPEQERIVTICKQLSATNIAFYENTRGFKTDSSKKLEQELLRITTRHPLREDQILSMFDTKNPAELQSILEEMQKKGLIRKVIHNNRTFWINAKSKIKSQKE